MDEQDRRPGTTPAGPVEAPPGRRRALVTTAVIVAALLIGLVKPWDLVTGPPAVSTASGAGGPAAGTGAVSAGTPGVKGSTARPTDGPGPDDGIARLATTCGSPSGWRIATIQAWTGRAAPIRSWIAIDPVGVAGPLDPRIPFVPVATDVVTAIGYCAPPDEGLRPPTTARAELWAIAAGIAVPLTPLVLEPDEPDALGGLWRPAPEVAIEIRGRAAWPVGRYVIRVRSPTLAFDRWLGIKIEDLGPRREGATASPSPPGAPVRGPSPSARASTTP